LPESLHFKINLIILCLHEGTKYRTIFAFGVQLSFKAAYLYVGTSIMNCRHENVIVGIGEDILFLSPSYNKITSKTPEMYITTLALICYFGRKITHCHQHY